MSYLSKQIVSANCLFHITDLISVATFIPSEMALRQYRSCFLRIKKIKYRKSRLKRMDNVSFPFLVHYAVLYICRTFSPNLNDLNIETILIARNTFPGHYIKLLQNGVHCSCKAIINRILYSLFNFY